MAEKAQDHIDNLADEDATSTDSELRYMAYASRLRTAVRTAHRYVAYTSDVGEAFRPLTRPWIVTGAYAISWLYLGGDVAFETWKAKRRGPDPLEAATFTEPQRLAVTAVHRATFQALASMALPAFTIHTVVRQSTRVWKRAASPRLKAWGPTFTGLAVVPILPYLFDQPVEMATETVFEWLRQKWYERQAHEKNGRIAKAEEL